MRKVLRRWRVWFVRRRKPFREEVGRDYTSGLGAYAPSYFDEMRRHWP